MDVLIVNLLGLAAIVWIVWYFFLSRRQQAGSATVAGGRQEIHVTVKGGYVPERIEARPGVPLRIHFRREETSPCSEEVVFPDFGIRRFLPAFEVTVVDLPASPAGRYGFACGMDMLHGTLVVGEAAPVAAPAAAPGPAVDRSSWPTDPVCGMKVDPERPAATSVKDGVTYYFCNPGCKTRFDSGGGPALHPPGAQGMTLGVRRRA